MYHHTVSLKIVPNLFVVDVVKKTFATSSVPLQTEYHEGEGAAVRTDLGPEGAPRGVCVFASQKQRI